MVRKIRVITSLCGLVLVVYFLSWTLAFILVQTRLVGGNGVDFGYYLDFLVAFWTWRGGEAPFFIGAGSIIICIGALVPIAPRAYRRLSNAK